MSTRLHARCRPSCLGALTLAVGAPAAAQCGDPVDDPVPGGIPASTVVVELVPMTSGLTAPNWGIDAPGLPGTLFVTDQNGWIWSVDLATGAAHAYLDLSDRLVPLGAFGQGSFDERGLLGIAFHPDFATNGRLYTYTSQPMAGDPDFSTMPDGVDPNHHAVITEWTVDDSTDPMAVVDPGSARELLRVAEPQFNHNAGALAFGLDGMLYVAFGDGGGADDEDGQMFIGAPIVGHGTGNGQDTSNPLGSILRIDPDGNDSANGAYGIPIDNPFAGMKGSLGEIWAYGFRNPFRFSFDTATGDLWVGDVGQNDLEEVDVVVAGGNYGWNRREGSFAFCTNDVDPGFVTNDPPNVDVIDPVAEYDHDEGIAIIGGFVYRGTKIAPLAGRYVFGEFAQTFSNDGRLFHLDGAGDIVELQRPGGAPFGLSLLGFAEDARGELYALVNDSGVPFGAGGRILRIATRTGDVDADGAVGVTDLLALLSAWGACTGCPEDIDDDGMVGVGDLLALLAHWD